MKVHLGQDGRVVTYGLDGEKARNYVKFGQYVKDADLESRLSDMRCDSRKRRSLFSRHKPRP